jgi:hypothetical protein
MTVAGFERFSLIKSVQQFTVTIAASASSGTATIASVAVKNSLLLHNGYKTTATSSQTVADHATSTTLTNATTVTAYRDTATATYTVTFYGTIVEFVPGVVKSIQYISFTFVGSGGGDAYRALTITAVNTIKAFMVTLGVTENFTGHPYQTKQGGQIYTSTQVRWFESSDAYGSGFAGGHREAVVELW